MKLKPIVVGIIAGSLFASAANAVIGTNNNDRAFTRAAYDFIVNPEALRINIPGAESQGVNPGGTDTGSVTGLASQYLNDQANYRIRFTPELVNPNGDTFNHAININGGATATGLALFESGEATNDIGAVLQTMQLQTADGTAIPIQIGQGNGIACTVSDNTVQFSGGQPGGQDGGVCAIRVAGSTLSPLTIANPGRVDYTMSAGNEAHAGATYRNDLNYTISVLPT